MGNQQSTSPSGSQEQEKEQERKDGKFPTVESWNDAEARLVVTQPEGWACKVSLRTKIALPPADLYDLLTRPDNSDVFRNIKRLKHREVLEDDQRGRQLVAVEQEGVWRCLCFSGTLNTNLYVRQNRRTREIDFKLREPGLMKKFEGLWRIQPFNQDSLDSNFGFKEHSGSKQGFQPLAMIGQLTNRFKREDDAQSSLLTLEQSLLPSVTPPKALQGITKAIAVRQVRNLIEDVRKEVDRREAEKRRSQPIQSTSAAPLASMMLFYKGPPLLPGSAIVPSSKAR